MTDLYPTKPSNQLVRSQHPQTRIKPWRAYSHIVIIAVRADAQLHALPLYQRPDTALDRNNRLRKTLGKVGS